MPKPRRTRVSRMTLERASRKSTLMQSMRSRLQLNGGGNLQRRTVLASPCPAEQSRARDEPASTVHRPFTDVLAIGFARFDKACRFPSAGRASSEGTIRHYGHKVGIVWLGLGPWVRCWQTTYKPWSQNVMRRSVSPLNFPLLLLLDGCPAQLTRTSREWHGASGRFLPTIAS